MEKMLKNLMNEVEKNNLYEGNIEMYRVKTNNSWFDLEINQSEKIVRFHEINGKRIRLDEVYNLISKLSNLGYLIR